MSESNIKYVTHLLSYLGVALLGGSIVHIGTLDAGNTRYVTLGCVGLAMMIIGSVLEARISKEAISVTYVGTITALAVSTGLLSGGIQHFLDNPVYAGYLLATGIIVSYLAFASKYHLPTTAHGIITVVLVALTIVVASNTVIYESLPHSDGTDHH